MQDIIFIVLILAMYLAVAVTLEIMLYRLYYWAFKRNLVSNFVIHAVIVVPILVRIILAEVLGEEYINIGHTGQFYSTLLYLSYILPLMVLIQMSGVHSDFMDRYNKYPEQIDKISVIQFKQRIIAFDVETGQIEISKEQDMFGLQVHSRESDGKKFNFTTEELTNHIE